MSVLCFCACLQYQRFSNLIFANSEMNVVPQEVILGRFSLFL